MARKGHLCKQWPMPACFATHRQLIHATALVNPVNYQYVSVCPMPIGRPSAELTVAENLPAIHL